MAEGWVPAFAGKAVEEICLIPSPLGLFHRRFRGDDEIGMAAVSTQAGKPAPSTADNPLAGGNSALHMASSGAERGWGRSGSELALDTTNWYHHLMRGRHHRTLEAVFADPVRANLPWSDVEALFIVAGASIAEGRGSRLRVSLNGVDAVFHRPHPAKETGRGALKSVRRFLREAGVIP